jgi:ribosomal protein S18 acetylase RimI-like enzyme
MVSLVPMERDAWAAWRVDAIRDYAADMARVGTWAPDEAEQRASSLFANLLPDGAITPGHEFRTIVAETGAIVGALWFAAEGDVGQGTALIWDIVINEADRGRGYGRAAMEVLEPLARSLGYDAVRLHMFGDNAVARHLYQAVGYVETDVTMLKRLG